MWLPTRSPSDTAPSAPSSPTLVPARDSPIPASRLASCLATQPSAAARVYAHGTVEKRQTSGSPHTVASAGASAARHGRSATTPSSSVSPAGSSGTLGPRAGSPEDRRVHEADGDVVVAEPLEHAGQHRPGVRLGPGEQVALDRGVGDPGL